jgi:hypothetical protein
MLRPITLVLPWLAPVAALSLGCSGSSGQTGSSVAGDLGGSTNATAASGGRTVQSGGASAKGGSSTPSGGASSENGGSSNTGGTSPSNSTSNPGTSAVGGTISLSSTAAGGAPSQAGASASKATGSKAAGGATARTSASGGGKSGKAAGGSTNGGVTNGGASVAGSGTSIGGATTAASTPPSSGECDEGTTTTTWASDCPTAAPTACTAGTWVAGGPDPDHSAFTLRAESDHFAVYADESSTSASTADSAVKHLETVWSLYFGSPMYMREPFCNSSTKYKASVHVHSDWGLTGGAFGTNRMGMWIGSGGLSDHWGLAHEFMHGVQSVQGGLSCNQSNTCGWIYESHANWAAQQQTEYHASDVHCSEMLANMPHLYLGSTRDRYCNWQFMEYLKDKYCFSAVNAIWTGTATTDPFTAIRNAKGWSVSQLNDFMGEWAMHNVTWDYQDPLPQSTAGKNQGALFRSKYGIITNTSQTIRRLRTTKLEPLDENYATSRRFISPFSWAPQRYGYNVVRLYPESGKNSVTITFRGVTSAKPDPDWRWGLVATDSGITTPRYSALQSGSDGSLTFCTKSEESLFLVVVATPSAWTDIVWDQAYNTVARYPYMLQLDGAWPEGFQNGAADACPSGLTRATNGGGCAPSGTSVYVGPYATVLSGATVSGDARIEDHAIVARGTVSGGTVGAMTLIGSDSNAFTMTSGTAKTTFYPLGFFESGQSLKGGTLIGDVEYRGDGYSRSSGTCAGFVDSSTCVAPGTDTTPAPPYAWR